MRGVGKNTPVTTTSAGSCLVYGYALLFLCIANWFCQLVSCLGLTESRSLKILKISSQSIRFSGYAPEATSPLFQKQTHAGSTFYLGAERERRERRGGGMCCFSDPLQRPGSRSGCHILLPSTLNVPTLVPLSLSKLETG